MNNDYITLKNNLKKYLVLLLSDVDKLVELYSEGKDKLACEYVAVITDKVAVVMETLNVIETIVSIEDINDILMQIVEGLQNEDYVLVGDLFNYEIKPLLEEILSEL